MGALKSALTAIFNANNYTASTSGISNKNIPVNESSGLPSGQIGMSELASFVNQTQFTYLSNDDDLNNYVGNGLRLQGNGSDSILNKPDSSLHNFIVFVFKQSNNRYIQVMIVINSEEIYYRVYSTIWKNWWKVNATKII